MLIRWGKRETMWTIITEKKCSHCFLFNSNEAHIREFKWGKRKTMWTVITQNECSHCFLINWNEIHTRQFICGKRKKQCEQKSTRKNVHIVLFLIQMKLILGNLDEEKKVTMWTIITEKNVQQVFFLIQIKFILGNLDEEKEKQCEQKSPQRMFTLFSF